MARTFNLSADRVLWMEQGMKARSVPRRPRLLLFTLFLLFLIGASLIYVWSRIQVIQTGYEISDAMKAGRALGEANKRLRVEVEALKSYSRIERIATEELRMSKPTADQVIIIR